MKATCPNPTPRGPVIRRHAVDLLHDADGAIAIEYGLIAALVAVAILGSIIQLGEALFALPLQSIIDAIMGVLS